ncbi:hypothetical protein ANCCEY_13350 [Ancylostoma ceylanicum]|uniref:RNA-directed DNA polymerase n=1 Tax=Ancylostoma ceylanicum TaxID=53326 RepID=A0A0D6L911_9BILA|nr:hypothetical protein ANCCEY_13350 [Ancylostoma ceylanicum]
MADQKVNILLSAPATEEVEVDFPIPVRVAETTVLHPSAETFVPCYSEVSDNTPLLLSAQSPQLSESDRISRDSYDLGSYEESEIVIKTTTEVPPTRSRPPRIPIKFQKELDEHINKLLRAGRIVESDTPWVHNTVLVKKKDGSLRVCLDFRPLNEITIPDHYPLPRIDDILAKIAGHRYYTTLDLASGYMQLLLSPESQEKCGKALSDSQKKWSPTHVELFAIISALRFFRATIYGNHTTIFSDHRPLTFLLKHNKTHDNLARWVVELQSYDVSIEYLKGSSNVVADALSRSVNKHVRFRDDAPESDDIVEFPVSINTCHPRMYSVRSPIVYAGCPVAIRPYDALVEQQADQLCSTIMSFIETQQFPGTVSEEEKPALLMLAEKCNIKANGCLYYRDPAQSSSVRIERLVVPEKLREPIFIAFHTSPSAGGHFNWRKTLTKIARRYFWPHMAEDVYALVRSCEPCQRKRAQRMNREHLLPVASGAVFDKVYVDLTGPIHTSDSGNKYIIAMIDHFTKYVVAAPLPDCSAITVAQAVMTECILKYGGK